jgi:zinc protease
MRNLVILMVLTVFCAGQLTAQSNVQLPELSYKRLLNGLQVTVAETPYLDDTVTIGLVLRYGSAFDPANKGGLADLVSRMFMKATAERTAQDIQDELAYLGATIEIQCNWDGFRFLLKVHNSQYERSLLLLHQVIGEAQFHQDDFASVKEEILGELAKKGDPRQQIYSLFENVLFKDTTYGRPLIGTPETIKNIKLGDVRYFYHRFFSPSEASLLIVGNVPASVVLQRASRIWGVWIRKEEVPFTFLPPSAPKGHQIFVKDDPESPAAQFILGGLFPPRGNPVYENALLASRILQERLTNLLPTSLLTVGSQGRRMTGPFFVQGQSAAEQAVDEIQKILGAVQEMSTSPISGDELAEAQKQLIDEFMRELNTTEGICNIMLDAELYRLGSNYGANFADSIRRCDTAAVQQTAADWILPEGAVLLLMVPADTLKPALERLGTFHLLKP